MNMYSVLKFHQGVQVIGPDQDTMKCSRTSKYIPSWIHAFSDPLVPSHSTFLSAGDGGGSVGNQLVGERKGRIGGTSEVSLRATESCCPPAPGDTSEEFISSIMKY